MASTLSNCPRCGGPLTAAHGDPARRTCGACGRGYAMRPRQTVAPALAPLPDSGVEPHVKAALFVGGLLAFLFLGLVGIVVLTVVLWPRPAAPAAAAALPLHVPPAAPPVDHPSDPAPVDPPPDAPKRPATPVAPRDDAPPAPPNPEPPLAPPDLKPAAPDPAPAANPPAEMTQGGLVNRAIDKAVVYLKRAATDDAQTPRNFPVGFAGGQTGVMGLIGLALLESGVPADDPAVVACLNAVRSAEPTCGKTYEMAISIWFLDRLNDPKDEDLIHDLAARLIAGQMEHGKWNYDCPLAKGAGARNPAFAGPAFGLGAAELTPEQLKELIETLDKYDPSKEIPSGKHVAPVCKYVRGKKIEKAPAFGAGQMPFAMMGVGDLSLTQFAVLGLWAARKHHMPVDRSLLLAEAFVRSAQSADGGWSYNGAMGMPTTESMTCSGMMELAAGRAVGQPQGGKSETADPQFEKGLEYLAELFDRGSPRSGDKAAPDPAQLQNLTAAVLKLQLPRFTLTNPTVQAQPTLWKRALKDFQDELERSLALDLPADAKKDLQGIDDQIKKYDDAPAAEKNREQKSLEQMLQKSTTLQGGVAPAFGGFMDVPGRLLKPGKSNRANEDDLYCLWSLERLCMVCDLKTVAGRDWYAWGAKLLVDHQDDDGGWNANGMCPPVVETCMAVLFLKRVNVAKDLTVQLKATAPVKDLSAERLKFLSTKP